MKLKSFIILLVVCAVLGVAAYFTLMKKEPEATGPKMGDLLFEDFPVNDVARISITNDEGTVTLQKDKVWGVVERYNYPADFDKIRTFVKKFLDLRLGNVFKGSKDSISRLKLAAPDQEGVPQESKGARITLEDKQNKPVIDIIIGASRKSGTGGGHYLRMADEEKVYLVAENFRYIDDTPKDWIEKDLLSADAADIKSMACYPPETEEPLYSLKRSEKNKDAEFVAPPEDKKIKDSKISSVMRAIASIRTEDIADPAKGLDEIGMESPHRFEYRTFDGTVYKIRTGKSGEGDSAEHYLKLEVSFMAPEETEESETEGETMETEAEGAESAPAAAETDSKSPEEIAKEAETLNEKVEPWTYIISQWKYEAFETDLNEFYEEETKAD